LAGFSFGSVIAAQLNEACISNQLAAQQALLIGTAISKWRVPAVAPSSLVVHGALDDVITLTDVKQRAAPLRIPVCVIDDTQHFFMAV
jgi:uncharacterized protein